MNVTENTYQWARALYPRQTTDCVVLHHAAAKSASPDDIHRAHLARGWSGIGYHYYIRKDGTIYRGRPEKMTGGHCEGENYHTIGICFEGNFMDETMPDKQLEAGRWLLDDIRKRHPNIHVVRHKDLNSTSCPGTHYPFDKMTEVDEVTTTTITATMNGRETKLTSIIHNGENYVRLRDLADAQSDDKLTVTWDAAAAKVVIQSK